jgi:hypothetical protein
MKQMAVTQRITMTTTVLLEELEFAALQLMTIK